MSNIDKVQKQSSSLLFAHGGFSLIAVLLTTVIAVEVFSLSLTLALIIAGSIGLIVNAISTAIMERTITHPLLYLAQSIEHIVSSEPLAEKKVPAGRYGHEIIKHVVDTVGKFMQQVEKNTDATHFQAELATKALNNMMHPALALDNKQTILFANKAAAELVEQPVDAIIGKPVYEALSIEYQGNSFLPRWIEENQQNVVNSEKTWQGARYLSPNRVVYNFDVHATFIRNEREGLETIAVLIDRTDERAYDDLKVDFAAMAAHELRAPITVIRGYVDVFEGELTEQLDDEQKMFLQKLKVSAAQLSGFINNVLNVARIDKGALQINVEKYDWADVIKEAINDLQLRAQAHGKKLELTIEEDLPPVAVDAISITEVINNLVDNAIKYSHDGDTIKVEVGLSKNGDVETTVTDSGVGIPANLMDKLFTKFYRSHRTRRDFTGSGLGLYLSKAIVDSHHGNIWAKSKEGKGSTFGFDLPPYDTISAKLEGDERKTLNVNRGKHGWIKNHSLYRR